MRTSVAAWRLGAPAFLKSRLGCGLVAMLLSLPIALSFEVAALFHSHLVLDNFGVPAATLNLPGLIVSYLLRGHFGPPTANLISVGDLLIYIPAIYAVLRYVRRERAQLRRTRLRTSMPQTSRRRVVARSAMLETAA